MQGLYEETSTRTGNGQPHKTKSKSASSNKNPLAVHFGGLQNLLRLRTNYRFNEKLSGQVGADLNLQQQSVFPAATLQYEVCICGGQINPCSSDLLTAVYVADHCKGQALGCTASHHSRPVIQESHQFAKKECKLQGHRQSGLQLPRYSMSAALPSLHSLHFQGNTALHANSLINTAITHLLRPQFLICTVSNSHLQPCACNAPTRNSIRSQGPDL